MQPDKKIIDFLTDNQVASVCFVTAANAPYCISCFYAFDEASMMLVFKSGFGTAHDAFIRENAPVSGTILPENIKLIALKGIQFTGKLLAPAESASPACAGLYTRKFPMNLAIPGYIWAARLDFIKMTDNTFGFGNKLSWSANPAK